MYYILTSWLYHLKLCLNGHLQKSKRDEFSFWSCGCRLHPIRWSDDCVMEECVQRFIWKNFFNTVCSCNRYLHFYHQNVINAKMENDTMIQEHMFWKRKWPHLKTKDYKVIMVYATMIYLSPGTYPGGNDITSTEISKYETRRTWSVSSLNLITGKTYYSSVTAVNLVGLETTAHGDGFTVS